MAPVTAVEISDLRGWAAQVGRSGTHLFEGHNYAIRNVNDPDFGRIMNLIKSDYETLLPALHDVLLASSENMDKAKLALEITANDYVDVDRQIAGSLAGPDGNVPVDVADDGAADGFGDISSPTEHLKDPNRGGKEMPKVSFGIAWDKVCDLLVMLGASAPRTKVAALLAGDIPKPPARPTPGESWPSSWTMCKATSRPDRPRYRKHGQVKHRRPRLTTSNHGTRSLIVSSRL